MSISWALSSVGLTLLVVAAVAYFRKEKWAAFFFLAGSHFAWAIDSVISDRGIFWIIIYSMLTIWLVKHGLERLPGKEEEKERRKRIASLFIYIPEESHQEGSVDKAENDSGEKQD